MWRATVFAVAPLAWLACGFSEIGSGAPAPPSGDTPEASTGTDPPGDGGTSTTPPGIDAAAPVDAAAPADAAAPIPRCPQLTGGAFSLSSFAPAGTGKVSGSAFALTPMTNNQAGAAWYDAAFTAAPTMLTVSFGFDEPNPNQSVDGAFTVAFLSSGSPPGPMPTVGNAGTSGGVCGLAYAGFAVIVDVARSANGANGDSVRIIDVGTCAPVPGASNKDTPGYLGNKLYSLSIKWTSATTVEAAINGVTATGTVTTPSPMYFGVTAATGVQPSSWMFYGANGILTGCP